MHPLRGWPAFLPGARLDAKLVDFDMPEIRPQLRRGQTVEQGVAGGEARWGRGMCADGLGHGVKPAVDPAIDRVVIAALVMGLVRLSDNRLGAGAETGKTAAAVAPAIGHVGIDAEIVPA